MANEKVREAVGTVLDIGDMVMCNVSLGSLGFDGGDPIDNTCLTNTDFITKQPQALIEIPDFSFTCDYHPNHMAAVQTEINLNQSITLTFPALGFYTFWGYLKSYTPNEASRGEAWRASCSVVVTNYNGTAETATTWTAA